MNVEKIDSTISLDVRYDAFDNSIRVGDIVYFVSRTANNLRLGIINKFCPEQIKIYDGKYEFNISNSSDIIKVNAKIDKDRIDNLKKLMDAFNSKRDIKKATLTRYMVFIYRNQETGKRGIGWWMIHDFKENHKQQMDMKLKEASDNKYDIYFAHKKDGNIAFDKSPNILPKKDGIFAKKSRYSLTSIPYLTDYDINEIRYHDLVEDENLKKDIIERRDFEKGSYGNREDFFRGGYTTAKNAFFNIRQDLMFKLPNPKVGKMNDGSFDNFISDIICHGDHYIAAPGKATPVAFNTGRLYKIQYTFMNMILVNINMMIDEDNENEVEKFFNNITNAIYSI